MGLEKQQQGEQAIRTHDLKIMTVLVHLCGACCRHAH
jgi:hypothetical protein